MAQEQRLQEATDLAMAYQAAINKGELEKAFNMVLPKEREALGMGAFMREKAGVDTIIENVSKFHPDIGTITVESATYDEQSKMFQISVKERYPDANMLQPIFSEVMADFFGVSDADFDQQIYKDKVKKAISKNKKVFKKGQLLDVIITENVEEVDGKLLISPGWIEEIRKREEKQANMRKAMDLSSEVFKEEGSTGNIFKALELYRELIQLDDSYVEKYGDIPKRAEITPKVTIEIIPQDSESDSMVKVNIINGSDTKIFSVNIECELLDEKGEKIFSEINQNWHMEGIEAGATFESWAMFDKEAGKKRKEVKLNIVGVTLK